MDAPDEAQGAAAAVDEQPMFRLMTRRAMPSLTSLFIALYHAECLIDRPTRYQPSMCRRPASSLTPGAWCWSATSFRAEILRVPFADQPQSGGAGDFDASSRRLMAVAGDAACWSAGDAPRISGGCASLVARYAAASSLATATAVGRWAWSFGRDVLACGVVTPS
ncbi:hypothetical protein M4D79_16105 [Mycolicibacterium novocastrense]|nr:hypothetical protein M4D79_16105 [Mycolicibacterium novocastrense]